MPSLTITDPADGVWTALRRPLPTRRRAYPVCHAGAFRTMREARARRDLVGGEIAAGRNPQQLLEQMTTHAPVVRTFADWAEAYRQSRVDLAPGTAGNLSSQLAVIIRGFGPRDPATITTSDVQEWISGLALKPSTIRRYLATLRLVMDYAEVVPNPARGRAGAATPPGARADHATLGA